METITIGASVLYKPDGQHPSPIFLKPWQ
uniref:Uncharacterized protein n=1 Tax=Anguilla anguilla TaxID=7936 RepID=A0A0E9S418_ANGAN